MIGTLYCGIVVALVAIGSVNVVMSAAGEPAAQAGGKTVWDGVYTNDQSTKGKSTADASCVLCHGEQLSGSDLGPGLQGNDFRAAWSGRSAGDLFDKIKTTMPADAPGSLNPQQTTEVVAYILKLNDFPAGETELSSEMAALNEIKIRSQK